jgi:ABC-type lipoprotein release transport system permease subunit
MLAGYDDAPGVLRNMGLTPSGRQLYFTSSSAIAVVNSAVGGAALGIALWVALDASLAAAAIAGAVVLAVSVTVHLHWARQRLEAGVPADVLFPSPST